MKNLDKAQEQHDLDKQVKYYPEDDNICLRCEEELAEDGEDFCEYCQDLIKERNRSKFIARETY